MELPSLEALRRAADCVYAALPATPQYCWPLLSARCGCELWVKHENHTPIGAFKVRGGLVYMDDLRRSGAAGVITATRGNHGQSVGFAAARHGMKAVVVVPKGNSVDKNRAMSGLGVDLIVHGHDFQSAREHAVARAAAEGLVTIPPFHELLVRGVATYAMEFLSAVAGLDMVYVPVGMGSGIAGMISAREALVLRTEVVGVVADRAPAYALSFAAGRPVATDSADTMADGLACRLPDDEAVALINAYAARVVRVSEAEIEDAMRVHFQDTHNVAEGAGAAPLAAVIKERAIVAGKRVGIVLSGGNVDAAVFRRVLAGAG